MLANHCLCSFSHVTRPLQVGDWTLDITNGGTEQRVSVSVTGAPAPGGASPIIVHAYWGLREVDGSNPDQRQTIHAMLTQGVCVCMCVRVRVCLCACLCERRRSAGRS